ncbi:hypothetical protein GF361_01475 [Candidatus Woesearchaeota archaeon]|nr:hypothetical protein [Candidatus Woesearchaeota archaeon]
MGNIATTVNKLVNKDFRPLGEITKKDRVQIRDYGFMGYIRNNIRLAFGLFYTSDEKAYMAKQYKKAIARLKKEYDKIK